MRTFRLAALLLPAVLTEACLAEEWTAPKHNCAVTLPAGEGWVKAPATGDPDVILRVAGPEGRIFVLVAMDTSDARGVLDDEAAKAFEASALKDSGGTKVYGKRITLHGLPAHEVLARMKIDGQDATVLLRLALTDTRMYFINATRVGGDVVKDEELQKILNSFRYIKPPGAPKAAGWTLGRGGYKLIGLGAVLLLAGVLSVWKKLFGKR